MRREQKEKGAMKRIVAMACVVSVFFASADFALAGLGDTLPTRTPEEALRALKSSDAYAHALKALEAKGFSKERADAALEKLPQEQLSLLGAQADGVKAGGLLDLLLFILFVALIVYLIILLVEASSYHHY